MKNLSRLTALLLALVMLLSITASATEISNYTKADYDADVVAAQSQTEITAPGVLTAEHNGFSFAVEGEVPETAQLYVTHMGDDTAANIRTNILSLPELEEGMSEYAFDITIVNDNAVWQPGTPVEVTINGLDTTSDSFVQVYHIPDSQPAVATLSLMDEDTTPAMTFEEVEATPGEGTVTFMADGFSIYYVVEGEPPNQVSNRSVTMEKGETITLYSDNRLNDTNNTSASWRYSTSNNYSDGTALADGETAQVGAFTLKAEGRNITITANESGTIYLNYRVKYDMPWLGEWTSDDRVTVNATAPIYVTFNANGGIGDNYSLVTTNGAFSFPDPESIGIKAQEGYQFAGWSASTSGQGTVYSVGLEQSVSRNTTYYAIWFDKSSENGVSAYFHVLCEATVPYEPTRVQTGVKYTQNHGMSGTLRNAVAICNNEAAVAANILQAPDNEVIEQRLAAKGVTVKLDRYDENGVVIEEGTHEIIWYVIKWNGCNCSEWHVDGYVKEKTQHMVYYHPNGGSTYVPPAKAYTPGVSVDVDYQHIPTRTGYIFLGWDENPNATTPTYTQSGTNNSFTMPAEDVNLYAIWRPSESTKYTVEHYLCDENGENAVWHETEEKYGTTDSTVTAGYKTYAGYEAYPGHADTVASGVVAADGTLVLKLYYKLSVADLTISKTVINANEAFPDTADPDFTFTVVFGDGSDTTTSYNYTKSDNTTGTIVSGGTITLKAGQTATIKDVTIGTNYTVTEINLPNGYSIEPASASQSGKIDAEGSTAAFTNTYTTGSLTITKSGMAADETESAIFTATIGGKTYTVVLNKDNKWSETIVGLKYGTSYSVAEKAGWTWRYTLSSSTDTSGTISGSHTASFGNTKNNDKWLSDESAVENKFN